MTFAFFLQTVSRYAAGCRLQLISSRLTGCIIHWLFHRGTQRLHKEPQRI